MTVYKLCFYVPEDHVEAVKTAGLAGKLHSAAEAKLIFAAGGFGGGGSFCRPLATRVF